MRKLIFLLIISIVMTANAAFATPFTIFATLTGDPRPGNPDNLFVDVTISGNTGSSDTFWTIDLNSPLHSDMKLDAFYFNLDVVASNVTFSGFSPTGWTVTSPANNASGSGSADFDFEADKPGSVDDVTNSTNLMFTASLNSGFWSENDFFDAPYATSSDNLLGSFQLGAHLQSLNAGVDESDSGFATGNYNGGGSPVPEPTTMLLFGTGLVGLAGVARRKKK